MSTQAQAWEESVRALSEAAERTEYDAPASLQVARFFGGNKGGFCHTARLPV